MQHKSKDMNTMNKKRRNKKKNCQQLYTHTLDLRMMATLWAHRPVSWSHMSFRYPFLTTSLAIHHSHKGIQFRIIVDSMSLSIRHYPSPFQKGAAHDLVAHDNPFELHNHLAAPHWSRPATPFNVLSEIAVRRSFWPHHRLPTPTGVTATWKLLFVTDNNNNKITSVMWWKHIFREQWTKLSLGSGDQKFRRSLPTHPPTHLPHLISATKLIYMLQRY